jgi:hypothetical protein
MAELFSPSAFVKARIRFLSSSDRMLVCMNSHATNLVATLIFALRYAYCSGEKAMFSENADGLTRLDSPVPCSSCEVLITRERNLRTEDNGLPICRWCKNRHGHTEALMRLAGMPASTNQIAAWLEFQK